MIALYTNVTQGDSVGTVHCYWSSCLAKYYIHQTGTLWSGGMHSDELLVTVVPGYT